MSSSTEVRTVPKDVLARFGRLGRDLSTVTVLLHHKIAEQMGLSGTDHKCLEFVLGADEPLTAGQIARLSGLSTGAVTGVIDRLERRGFVRRIRDPHDRRKVLVEVAEFDETRYMHLFQDQVELTERVLGEFSPHEWEVIERYNRALIEGGKQLISRRD